MAVASKWIHSPFASKTVVITSESMSGNTELNRAMADSYVARPPDIDACRGRCVEGGSAFQNQCLSSRVHQRARFSTLCLSSAVFFFSSSAGPTVPEAPS